MLLCEQISIMQYSIINYSLKFYAFSSTLVFKITTTDSKKETNTVSHDFLYYEFILRFLNQRD